MIANGEAHGCQNDKETTDERILTGGDFDIESVRRTPDGAFCFGEEFVHR
jgi:hypothetical protein